MGTQRKIRLGYFLTRKWKRGGRTLLASTLAKRLPVAFLMSLVATSSLCWAAAPSFLLEDLGPIDLRASSTGNTVYQDQLLRINNNGVVSGTSGNNAVVWVRDATTSAYSQTPVILPTKTGTIESKANSLNESGIISGSITVSSASVPKKTSAVIWSFDTASNNWNMIELKETPLVGSTFQASEAWDINDTGMVVGSVTLNNKKYAAFWQNSAAAPQLVPGGDFVESISGTNILGLLGEAYAISNNGMVGGLSGTPSNAGKAFYWSTGNQTSTVPTLASWGIGAINNFEIATGAAAFPLPNNTNPAPPFPSNPSTVQPPYHPFALTIGPSTATFQDMGPTIFGPGNGYWAGGNTSWGVDINDANYIVATTMDSPTPSPSEEPIILFQNGNIWESFKINPLLKFPQGSNLLWDVSKASGIANNGRITGLGDVGTEIVLNQGTNLNELVVTGHHAYVLTPDSANIGLASTAVSTPVLKPNTLAIRATNLDIQTGLTSAVTFNATNIGPKNAVNVSVATSFSSLVTVTSSPTGCNTSNTDTQTLVTCQLGEVAVNQVAPIEISFKPSVTGDLVVTSNIASDTNDNLDQSNNTIVKTYSVVAPVVVDPPSDNTGTTTNPGDSGGTSNNNSNTGTGNTTQTPADTGTPSSSPSDGTSSSTTNSDSSTSNSSSTSSRGGGCTLGSGVKPDGSLVVMLLLAIGFQIRQRFKTSKV